MSNDWIEWHGGECPVDAHEKVYIRFKNGEESKIPRESGKFIWSPYGSDYQIIAYRLHKPEQPAVPLTEQLREAIAKRDKQAAKAKRHAEKLEQREAEVQRLIGELSNDLSSQLNMPVKIWYVNELDGPSFEIQVERNDIPEGVDVDATRRLGGRGMWWSAQRQSVLL